METIDAATTVAVSSKEHITLSLVNLGPISYF
jgi:hypothetical protein